MSLKQTHSVAEFIDQFQLMPSRLRHAYEEMLCGAFTNELKEAAPELMSDNMVLWYIGFGELVKGRLMGDNLVD